MPIDVVFPQIYDPQTAQLLLIQQQFAKFERLSPREQSTLVSQQLSRLVQHASKYSTFWRDRLNCLKNGAPFHDLPPLTRADIQQQGDSIKAYSPEMNSRNCKLFSTSGSTGMPVSVDHYLPVYNPVYKALGIREMHWHKRDQSRDIIVIKDAPDSDQADWGTTGISTGSIGKMYVRNLLNYSPEDLWEWLKSQEAPYLATTPSMAIRLAQLACEDHSHSKRFEQVITFSEVVTPECRALVREAFNARVVDRYSCEELGWIALQCPVHDHYHALSASTIVEIVDENLRQVKPGESGKILLSSLHSYAMPLIRYDIGDYAVAGEQCDCGIQLPVISKILGRERSFLRLPDGSVRLAGLVGEYWLEIAPVDEYRLVQYADDEVEAFVVCRRKLADTELAAMKKMLGQVLHPKLEIVVTQVQSIDRGNGRKKIDVIRLDYLRQKS